MTNDILIAFKFTPTLQNQPFKRTLEMIVFYISLFSKSHKGFYDENFAPTVTAKRFIIFDDSCLKFYSKIMSAEETPYMKLRTYIARV